MKMCISKKKMVVRSVLQRNTLFSYRFSSTLSQYKPIMYDYFFRIIVFLPSQFKTVLEPAHANTLIQRKKSLGKARPNKKKNKGAENVYGTGNDDAVNRKESTLSLWTWKNYHYAEHLSGIIANLFACVCVCLCSRVIVWALLSLLFCCCCFRRYTVATVSVQFDVCHGVLNDANVNGKSVCVGRARYACTTARHSRCAKRRKKKNNYKINCLVWKCFTRINIAV